jgi:GYF domain 2
MYRIIGVDGKEYGPISADQLRQWIAEGRAITTTLVQAPDTTEWKTLGSIPEFSLLFTAMASAGTGPAPAVSIQRTNGFATAGFILGIVSILCVVPSIFCCCFGLPLNLLGVICSLTGLLQILRHPKIYSGRRLAIAGLILSGICLLLYCILIAIGVASTHWQDGTSHHVYRL